jgi:dTDP-4-amino-4,6-dideoxygalactose transaminase
MTPIRPKERFLVFGSPRIEDDEIAEVVHCLKTAWLGTGPKVAQLERDFRAYVGSGHAVALNSCTAALHLSMLACGLRPGDEVITTAMTFCASVNAIIHAGLKPVIVDVDRRTMNIDPAKVEAAITPRTRAILPVHFAGRPCEMDALTDLARRHDLRIVEDCAHAIETTYHGRHAGTFGEFGCFSFYVTKNVTTGEGGLVLARDEESASRIKVLGLHGMSKDAWKRFSDDGYKHYQVVNAGFKYNMPDLAAAIGIHQLKKVDAYWVRRQEIWQRYNEAFRGLPVETPADPAPDTKHAYHLYTLLIDEAAAGVSRDEVLTRMTRHNVGVGVHYQAIPEHPFYQQTFGWRPEHVPNAAEIGRRTMSIPLSAKLTDEDVADVIAAVRDAVGR